MKLSLSLLRKRPAGTSALHEPPTEHPRAEAAPYAPGRAPAWDRTHGVVVSEPQRLTYQLASLLVTYPTQEITDGLDELRDAVDPVYGPAQHLLPLLDYLSSTDLTTAQSAYVETFDLRRRCSLFLTYYAFGDTRRRGMALLDLKHTYAACGAEFGDDGDLAHGELPDHLAVLLEFTATIDPAVGVVLLKDLRPGLELLRISLAERESPWLAPVAAVCATLPTLDGSDKDAVRRLIAEGPPDEEVGVETYLVNPYLDSTGCTPTSAQPGGVR